MTDTLPELAKLAPSLPGWDLAKALGTQYTGDADPVSHDGCFYETAHWESDGYASAVRFARACDHPYPLFVERIVISKPDDMQPAFDCCGVNGADQEDMHAQIESCLQYGHYEQDSSDWREAASLAFIEAEDWDDDLVSAMEATPRMFGTGPDFRRYEDEEQVWSEVIGWIDAIHD